jgi:hypothetical protein
LLGAVAALRLFGVAVRGLLRAPSEWPAFPITITAGVVAVTTLAFSGARLALAPGRLDVAKGPATAWIALGVVAEVNGRAITVAICLVVALVVAVVAVISIVKLVRELHHNEPVRLGSVDSWPRRWGLGPLLFGLGWVIVLLPASVLRFLGEVPPRKPPATPLAAAR